MNKKGFTLIELLAVIVVLAIVAVIAVPMIFGIIEKVKKSALGSTANGLMDSAEVYYTKNLEETGENKVFLFDDSRNGETVDGEKISYKGSFEGTGSVRLYSNGKTAICITDGKYYALKNVSDNEVKTGSGTCSYDSETESYLSIGLVSKEQLDMVQAELDQIKSEKAEVIDALINKGVSITQSDSLGSVADTLNSTTIGKQLISLGTGTSFDLKTNYATYGLKATDYQSLTANNFIISVQTINASGSCVELSWSGGSSATVNVGKTYNSTTGVLTITNLSAAGGYTGSKYGSGSYNASIVISTYIVY